MFSNGLKILIRGLTIFSSLDCQLVIYIYIYIYTIVLFISNLLVFIKRTNCIYYEIATELLLDHKNDNIF